MNSRTFGGYWENRTLKSGERRDLLENLEPRNSGGLNQYALRPAFAVGQEGPVLRRISGPWEMPTLRFRLRRSIGRRRTRRSSSMVKPQQVWVPFLAHRSEGFLHLVLSQELSHFLRPLRRSSGKRENKPYAASRVTLGGDSCGCPTSLRWHRIMS